jgi:surface polysaccharide O-acyltransferase-like enzyme
MKIDRFPSTPMKLVTAWFFSVVFYVFAGYIIVTNRNVNESVLYLVAALIFGQDAVAAFQFKTKRETAWVPTQTASESAKPPTAGQPAVPVAEAP